MSVFLKKQGDEPEDGDIKVEAGDRRMAENFHEPQTMQDRPQKQEDDQCDDCIGDKGRHEYPSNHDLGECMRHVPLSVTAFDAHTEVYRLPPARMRPPPHLHAEPYTPLHPSPHSLHI